jgi:hypothetical protein
MMPMRVTTNSQISKPSKNQEGRLSGAPFLFGGRTYLPFFVPSVLWLYQISEELIKFFL